MKRWRYLDAQYPNGTHPSVGTERAYFDTVLGARGIRPERVEATADGFYELVAESAFDVLHLSCHAESMHESIEDSVLIIGDKSTPTGVEAIRIDAMALRSEGKLRKSRPLVFLNACETGRLGAVLTEWGGWPMAFLDAGAGAFIGSSWAVRDKPAAKFASTFYEAMLDGSTLAEAATKARAATKNDGDGTWLAFKVYGHPRARKG